MEILSFLTCSKPLFACIKSIPWVKLVEDVSHWKGNIIFYGELTLPVYYKWREAMHWAQIEMAADKSLRKWSLMLADAVK